MTEHLIRVTVSDTDPDCRDAEFVCQAPADALCRAVFDCDCDTLYNLRDVNGTPTHESDCSEFRRSETHTGSYGPDCQLKPWFDACDMADVFPGGPWDTAPGDYPVVPVDDGYCVTFRLAEGADR